MRDRQKVRGWILVLALFMSVGVMGAVRGARSGGDVVWQHNLIAAKSQAALARQPMLLSFHSPGCGYCQKMDAETYTDPKVVELSRRFMCVRLDSETEPEPIQRLNVFEFPTTILMSAQGKELARFSGYVSPDRFAKVLQLVLNDPSSSRR